VARERRGVLLLGRTGCPSYNLLDIVDTNREVRVMTSEKKAEANRKNALKSTGPRTPEGKDAVRLNALRHGLLSKEILLPGEDADDLRELGDRLRAELRPVGELENLLVDRIVATIWRLRRLGRVEAGIFAWELYEELAGRAEQEASKYEDDPYWDDLEEISDDDLEEMSDNEKKHEEALERARRMRRSAQQDETATLGRTFARDADGANAFSKLSRYETAIERQLYRALHELERHQAARLGGNVQAPLAVDVDVSGIPGGDG
jgi:hypothetical protein